METKNEYLITLRCIDADAFDYGWLRGVLDCHALTEGTIMDLSAAHCTYELYFDADESKAKEIAEFIENHFKLRRGFEIEIWTKQ